MGGYYKRMVEELYAKYNVSEAELFDPYSSVRVVLADDNPFCNSTLRKILEKMGKFQVHSFFNGNDVIALGPIKNRHANITRRTPTRSS